MACRKSVRSVSNVQLRDLSCVYAVSQKEVGKNVGGVLRLREGVMMYKWRGAGARMRGKRRGRSIRKRRSRSRRRRRSSSRRRRRSSRRRRRRSSRRIRKRRRSSSRGWRSNCRRRRRSSSRRRRTKSSSRKTYLFTVFTKWIMLSKNNKMIKNKLITFHLKQQ